MQPNFQRTLLLVLFFLCGFLVQAQKEPNWTKEQLLEPADLNAVLKNGKDLPVIISVGPGASIPYSVGMGMTNDPANLEKIKQYLGTLPKNSSIVLYCGCCPFEHCPNVRPAINVLQQLQFTQYKLLNLPTNLKKDWIDKGYVVE